MVGQGVWERDRKPQGLRLGRSEATGLMRGPGGWARGAESSAGSLVDLLAGGNNLAVLDLFHNGAHLTGGHGCRGHTLRGGQRPRDPGSAPTPERTRLFPQSHSVSTPLLAHHHIHTAPSLPGCPSAGPLCEPCYPNGWYDSDPCVLLQEQHLADGCSTKRGLSPLLWSLQGRDYAPVSPIRLGSPRQEPDPHHLH